MITLRNFLDMPHGYDEVQVLDKNRNPINFWNYDDIDTINKRMNAEVIDLISYECTCDVIIDYIQN